MSQTYEKIVDSIITKRPELAGQKEQLISEVEGFDSLVGQLMEGIQSMRSAIGEALSQQPDPDGKLKEETDRSFALWEINQEKFGALFGLNSADDVYKLVAMSVAQQKTSIDVESMKTFIMAMLCPEFDVMN